MMVRLMASPDPLIFFANSLSEIIFMKLVDTFTTSKSGANLFELLDCMIQEIAMEHVIQVVIDSASAYVFSNRLLELKHPRILWSQCAAHFINKILKDINELFIRPPLRRQGRSQYLYIVIAWY